VPIGDQCANGWMDVVKVHFLNRYCSYSFCRILTKVGTYDLCASMEEKLWDRFSKFYIKIFFYKFFKNFKLVLTVLISVNK